MKENNQGKKKKVTLAVTVDSDVKEKLNLAAKKEQRTLSNYVNMLLSNITNSKTK